MSNYGTTTLNNCMVSGYAAPNGGGGVFSAASLGTSPVSTTTPKNCTVGGNSANSGGGMFTTGGAICSFGSALMTVSDQFATITGRSTGIPVAGPL